MINLKNITNEIEKAARETAAFILKESESFDNYQDRKQGIKQFCQLC